MASTNTGKSEGEAMNPIPFVDLQADYMENEEAINESFTSICKQSNFILGPQVTQIETTLSTYLSSSSSNDNKVHCIAVSDGTAALQLCLMALNICKGHEVITTPFTWISSCEVIPLVGATPIFSDITHDNTYHLDIDQIESNITRNTRAVIVVSLFGRCLSGLNKLRNLLDKYEEKFGTTISVIEDGAQSFGAIDAHGYKSCSSPYITVGTTSFFPTKPLACYGDGGAIFTRDPQLVGRIKSLRVHGKIPGGKFNQVGLNSRLDTIQAGILLVKWNKFENHLKRRRACAKVYNDLLKNDNRVILPRSDDDNDVSAWGVFTIRVDKRDLVTKKLKDVGVACAVYYPIPCHLQPMFTQNDDMPLTLSVCQYMSKSVLSLPIHAYLTKHTQIRIVRELITALDDIGVTCSPS